MWVFHTLSITNKIILQKKYSIVQKRGEAFVKIVVALILNLFDTSFPGRPRGQMGSHSNTICHFKICSNSKCDFLKKSVFHIFHFTSRNKDPRVHCFVKDL